MFCFWDNLFQVVTTRNVPFDDKFYTGYRRNIIAPEEVLVSITIPCTHQNEQFVAFKQVSNWHHRKDAQFKPKIISYLFSRLITFEWFTNRREDVMMISPSSMEHFSLTLETIKKPNLTLSGLYLSYILKNDID